MKGKKLGILINLKLTKTDKKRIEALAKKYTSGNVSAWLRLAGLYYRPGS